MDVDANVVMQKLATRVAQLELEIAVMQSALEKYEERDKAQKYQELKAQTSEGTESTE